MSDYILAKYDVSGIQNYIFATNRLQENVGASYHVTKILEEFLQQALRDAAAKLKEEGEMDCEVILEWYPKNEPESKPISLAIKDNLEIAAEIIYIGGGNAMVMYRGREICRTAELLFAKKVTEECHGVSIFAAHVRTKMEDFSEDIKSLDLKLASVKREYTRQLPLSPYPIAEQDSTYGLPVTQLLENNKPVSQVQYEKRMAYEEYKKKYPYAGQVEDLTRKRGEDGYLAVVHIDGNGMGAYIQGKIIKGMEYQEAVRMIREISCVISRIYKETYRKVVNMIKLVRKESIGKEDGAGGEEQALPVRDLIQDGDDITFLCDARMAIPAAALFIRLLLQTPADGHVFSACAGIAFVHSHFPFQIAYELAEQCCGEAKKKWYGSKHSEDKKGAEEGWLDYHLVRGAYVKEMKEQRRESNIRKRPYRVARELQNGQQEADMDTIEFLLKICCKMTQKEGSAEIWPRSKLRQIYEAYLTDTGDLTYLNNELSSRGREMAELVGKEPGSFSLDKPCGIFDALEILDYYEYEIVRQFLYGGGEKTDGKKNECQHS